MHSNANCLRECIGVNEKSGNLRGEPNYNYVDNLCSNGKGRKGYKRNRYYDKEFADGILIFKADGYYCNYYKEIRFVRCFGKLNSGTKQFRAE